MSKEQIIAAVRDCAARLGRAPTLTELKRTVKVDYRQIQKLFGTYTAALQECGLERQGCGQEVKLKDLFTDWAGIVRRMGKTPTVAEYGMHSRYSVQPLLTKFGSWLEVPGAFLTYGMEQKLEDEWPDVFEVVRRGLKKPDTNKGQDRARTERRIPDRPIYGPSLVSAPLAHGPVNEAGVLYLFGVLAGRLGFVVMRVQTEFPDCEAMRKVGEDEWQRVRIEFEYESRNFLRHMHPAEQCDLIVCWRHNWPECPVEVLELRNEIGGG